MNAPEKSLADEIRVWAKILMREAADTSDERASTVCGEAAEKLDALADRVEALEQVMTDALARINEAGKVSDTIREMEYPLRAGLIRGGG